MSWSERLQELRNGSISLATAAEGQVGKLLRKVASRSAAPKPPPIARRFEPRSKVEPGLGPSPDRIGPDPTEPVYHPRTSVGQRPETPAERTRPLPIVTRCPSLQTGDKIGDDLQIERALAHGAAFDTYLARHLAWGIDLAVKVPREDYLASIGGLQAIAQAAGRWTALGLHPHIVYCYALEVIDGIAVLLLEHVDGGDLRGRLEHGFTADLRLGLSLAIQTCHALEHAHDDGLWHGAVTPKNLLFTADGSLLLTDLGISSYPRSGALHGDDQSPNHHRRYLAPEQQDGRNEPNASGDIFSLGVCMYETMCEGVSDDAGEDGRVAPLDCRLRGGGPMPDRLARLLTDCLATEPGQRPGSVADVRRELCVIYEEQFLHPSPHAELRSATCRSDGWNNQALVACWLGNNEEAETAWTNALQTGPGHPESTFNRALMRWRWGEISDEEALVEIEQLLDPNTRHEQIAHLLGLIHLERGDAESALPLLERAAQQTPDDGQLLEALNQARSEVDRGEAEQQLNGHEDFVSAVAIHPEKQWVLSGGDDCRMILWNVRECQPARIATGHVDRVSAVSLNGDGSIAVSGSDDATLRFWDTNDGSCLKSLVPVGAVFSVAISADGSRAVSSSSGTNNFLGIDNTVLQVWDVNKARCLGELVGHTSAAKGVALTADGYMALSAGDDHTVRVWDTRRLACRRLLEGHRHYVTSVAVTPDGTKALSGSWDQTMRVWNPATGECVRTFTGMRTILTCVGVSADGRTAICGCWDGSIRVWDIETGRCLRTLTGHSRMVTSVALSADGRMAVSGSWDATVRVWDLARDLRNACRPCWSHRH